MDPDMKALATLRAALAKLRHAEEERARAWALAGSGLLDPASGHAARMEADREIEDAHERIRRARAALDARPHGDKAWGGH